MPQAESMILKLAEKHDIRVLKNRENSGFSRTVNVGMQHAHNEGVPAVLVNQDLEFLHEGWVEVCESDPADLIGGKLLFPNGLLQHGGVYWSLCHQYFDHLFRLAPANLTESCLRWEMPVTGAFHYIKTRCMDKVGYYDPEYRLAFEDVDYTLRVFESGMKCAYNPLVVALHHEGMVRRKHATKKMQEWTRASEQRLWRKFAASSFTRFVHPMTREDYIDLRHPGLSWGPQKDVARAMELAERLMSV